MKKVLILAALFSLAAGFVACSDDDQSGQVPGKAVISGPSSNVFPETSVTLTATAEGATSYLWYSNTSLIPGETANTLVVTNSSAYSVAGVNDNGEGAKSDPKAVTIESYTITLTGASSNTCPSASVVLTASLQNATAYKWYKGGAEISGVTTNTYEATETGAYTVAGIIGTQAGPQSAPLNVTIVNCPKPGKATITGASENSCPAASVELIALATGDNLTGYKWYKGGIEIQGATTSKYVVTETDNYQAAGVNANGTGEKSDVKQVTISACAAVPEKAAITGASANACPATSVLLTATAGGATSYKWYNGSTVIPGATTNTYNVTATGTYYVEGINQYGTGTKSDGKQVTINSCGGGTVLLNLNTETTDTTTWLEILDYFTPIDADKDGYNWRFAYWNEELTQITVFSESYVNYVGPLTPENYLILPGYVIGTNAKFTFTAQALLPDYPEEKFKIVIITSDQITGITDADDIIPILRNAPVLHTHKLVNGNPYTQTLDIPDSYNGKGVFLAVAHFDCTDAYRLLITQLKLEHTPAGGAPPAPAPASTQMKKVSLANEYAIMPQNSLPAVRKQR
ncbi:MAG: choice-of-anchor J domain-containing protein [Prevotellaceae bacterium]|jgi:hypothetical protein|nr:choice-of-anchor J domain-containing protein [Prevotellaceae bacterium]